MSVNVARSLPPRNRCREKGDNALEMLWLCTLELPPTGESPTVWARLHVSVRERWIWRAAPVLEPATVGQRGAQDQGTLTIDRGPRKNTNIDNLSMTAKRMKQKIDC